MNNNLGDGVFSDLEEAEYDFLKTKLFQDTSESNENGSLISKFGQLIDEDDHDVVEGEDSELPDNPNFFDSGPDLFYDIDSEGEKKQQIFIENEHIGMEDEPVERSEKVEYTKWVV